MKRNDELSSTSSIKRQKLAGTVCQIVLNKALRADNTNGNDEREWKRLVSGGLSGPREAGEEHGYNKEVREYNARECLTGTTPRNAQGLVPNARIHPLLLYLKWCFSNHLEPVLQPEWFRLLILHGAAALINEEPQAYREALGIAQHEGKKETIVVLLPASSLSQCRDTRVWTTVTSGGDVSNGGFPEFVHALKKRMDPSVVDELIGTGGGDVDDDMTKMSVETLIPRIVGCMDAVQAYFDIRFRTRCGFPAVTLAGTKEEWQQVSNLITKLQARGANKRLPEKWNLWLSAVTACFTEILCSFERDMKGEEDHNDDDDQQPGAVNSNVKGKEKDRERRIEFWNSLFKYQSRSGGEAITGWITAFFPTCVSMLPVAERKLGLYTKPEFAPNCFSAFPSGMSKVPFVLEDRGKNYPMELYGGFSPLVSSQAPPTTIHTSWHIVFRSD